MPAWSRAAIGVLRWSVSIYVVRAFVQLRELLAGHKELTQRLNELETRMERKLMTQDQAIAGILDAIRQLMARMRPTDPPGLKREISAIRSDEAATTNRSRC